MTGLMDTTDAMVWAQEFCRIFNGQTITDADDAQYCVDVGTMVSWFANAIEKGRDTGRRELCPHLAVTDLVDGMRTCRDCGSVLAA
jgi:hypothetical protein